MRHAPLHNRFHLVFYTEDRDNRTGIPARNSYDPPAATAAVASWGLLMGDSFSGKYDRAREPPVR